MENLAEFGKNATDYDFPPPFTNKFVGAENKNAKKRRILMRLGFCLNFFRVKSQNLLIRKEHPAA